MLTTANWRSGERAGLITQRSQDRNLYSLRTFGVTESGIFFLMRVWFYWTNFFPLSPVCSFLWNRGKENWFPVSNRKGQIWWDRVFFFYTGVDFFLKARVLLTRKYTFFFQSLARDCRRNNLIFWPTREVTTNPIWCNGNTPLFHRGARNLTPHIGTSPLFFL